MCSRHSQIVQDPDWDRKDHSLGVPLRCVPRGIRAVPCRYAAREPDEKRSLSIKVWRGEGQEGTQLLADHLREERLAVHVHRWHVEPTYVQYGWSQVDVQDRSLQESGDKTESNKNWSQGSFHALHAVTSTVWLGAIPGPRTKSGTRMSNSYSCLLSMGSENWPKDSGDSKAAVREGADSSSGDEGDAAQTCVVAVVRGVEDVGVVQLLDAVQFLHQLFHHVIHRGERLPPAGQDRFLGAKYIHYLIFSSTCDHLCLFILLHQTFSRW